MSNILDMPLREIVAKYPNPKVIRGVMAMHKMKALERERLKERARYSFIDFAKYVDPTYVVDPMHALIASYLERIVRGEILRLLITAPPQTGKSRLASEMFPAYWFGRRPDDSIILASYGDTLASDKGLKAKDIVTSPEYGEIFPEIFIRGEKQARHDWAIASPNRGEFYSAGVGSGITGRGAGLGIIDDPVKNWEEAQSRRIKEKIWDWYESTFWTRIREGGAIVLMMTRWAKDDLFGKILLNKKEHWEILRLPALCESQEVRDKNNKLVGLPEGLPDPLGRNIGESVAPGRFTTKTMQERVGGISSSKSSAIYSGAPQSPEGDKIKRHWFDIVDPNEVPYKANRGRYWDPAGSKKKTSKFTAGVRGCIYAGIFYIEDVQRDRLTPAERNRLMRQTAEIDDSTYGRFEVKQWWEEEGGSSGIDSSDNYATEVFKGFSASKDRPSGSKDVRLDPFIGWAGQGRVKLVRGKWNEDWLDEMCSLTGVEDEIRDQADATAGLFNRLQDNTKSKYDPATEYEDSDENDVLASIGLRSRF